MSKILRRASARPGLADKGTPSISGILRNLHADETILALVPIVLNTSLSATFTVVPENILPLLIRNLLSMILYFSFAASGFSNM
ncbi:CDP-diacylglycerol--glycerol-3-phosphate 3-phosphatidyltransferase [Dirofilaria immitis]